MCCQGLFGFLLGFRVYRDRRRDECKGCEKPKKIGTEMTESGAVLSSLSEG